MPIEVELPDGSIAEFPDGTSNATMEMALAKYRAPKADFSGVRGGYGGTVNHPAKKPGRHAGQYGITPYMLDFADAAQHNSMNLLHAGAQLVSHGVQSATNALIDAPQQSMSGLITGQAPQPQTIPQRFRKYVNDTVAADDAALRQREADYQARTQDNPSSYFGSGVGQVAPWVAGAGLARAAGVLPTLPRVSQVAGAGAKARNLLAKGGLLAAEGGVMGLLTPVTGEGDFGNQKAAQVVTGAVAAPLLATSLGGGRAALNFGGRASRYLTNRGREAIANEQVARMVGQENLPALRGATAVDGFAPTPAQAIGTPEAVQAERVLRNDALSAPFFAQQESANNAALRAQVAKMAGTDEGMQAARRARSEATDPYYQQLASAKADPAPVMRALDALENSSLGTNKNVKAAIASLRSEIKSRLDSEGRMSADALSGLHSESGSHLGPMASPKEKKALGPVRDSIADALDAAVPGYRDNVAAYARLSQPISDMQAGRAVLDAIDSAARDAGGNQTVSLTRINAALAKDRKSRFPMSPQARAQLEAVRDALQQRSITNNTIAASGPGTAADVVRGGSPPWLKRAGAQIAGGVGAGLGGLPGYLIAAGATEGAMAARNSVTRKVGQKASSAAAAADAIEAYQRTQNRRGLLDEYLVPQYLLPYIQD